MKLSTSLPYTGDPQAAAARARDLEAAGIDMVWVAELYSFDAVSILGYLAAHTERVELGAGILPPAAGRLATPGGHRSRSSPAARWRCATPTRRRGCATRPAR
jgi:hypothetical protein